MLNITLCVRFIITIMSDQMTLKSVIIYGRKIN